MPAEKSSRGRLVFRDEEPYSTITKSKFPPAGDPNTPRDYRPVPQGPVPRRVNRGQIEETDLEMAGEQQVAMDSGVDRIDRDLLERTPDLDVDIFFEVDGPGPPPDNIAWGQGENPNDCVIVAGKLHHDQIYPDRVAGEDEPGYILRVHEELIRELNGEIISSLTAPDDQSVQNWNDLISMLDQLEKREIFGGGGLIQKGGSTGSDLLRKIYKFTRIARGCITVNAIRILLIKLLTIAFNTGFKYSLTSHISSISGTAASMAVSAASVSPIGAALGPYLAPVMGGFMVLYVLRKIMLLLKTDMSDRQVELTEMENRLKQEFIQKNLRIIAEEGAQRYEQHAKNQEYNITLRAAQTTAVLDIAAGNIPNLDERIYQNATAATVEQFNELSGFGRIWRNYMSAVDRLGGLPEDLITAIFTYLREKANGGDLGTEHDAYKALLDEIRLATIILSLSGADLGTSLAAHSGFVILSSAGNVVQTAATCAGVAVASRIIGRAILEGLGHTAIGVSTVYGRRGLVGDIVKALVDNIREDKEQKAMRRKMTNADADAALVNLINTKADEIIKVYVTGNPVVVENVAANVAENMRGAQSVLPGSVNEAGREAMSAIQHGVSVNNSVVAGVVGVGEGSPREEQSIKRAEAAAAAAAEAAAAAAAAASMSTDQGGGYKRKNLYKRKKISKRRKSFRKKPSRRNSRKTTVRRKSRRLSRKSKRLSRKLKK